MVEASNAILINNTVEAIITVLFRIQDGCWFIGYREKNGKEVGYFLEGDQEFKVIDKQVDREGYIQ